MATQNGIPEGGGNWACPVCIVKNVSLSSRGSPAEIMEPPEGASRSVMEPGVQAASSLMNWIPLRSSYPQISMEQPWLSWMTKSDLGQPDQGIIYAPHFSALIVTRKTSEAMI